MMNDLVFQGGSVGIRMNEQQYHFKGITFKSKHTQWLFVWTIANEQTWISV